MGMEDPKERTATGCESSSSDEEITEGWNEDWMEHRVEDTTICDADEPIDQDDKGINACLCASLEARLSQLTDAQAEFARAERTRHDERQQLQEQLSLLETHLLLETQQSTGSTATSTGETDVHIEAKLVTGRKEQDTQQSTGSTATSTGETDVHTETELETKNGTPCREGPATRQQIGGKVWVSKWDADSGRLFYYATDDRKPQWSAPPGWPCASPAPAGPTIRTLGGLKPELDRRLGGLRKGQKEVVRSPEHLDAMRVAGLTGEFAATSKEQLKAQLMQQAIERVKAKRAVSVKLAPEAQAARRVEDAETQRSEEAARRSRVQTAKREEAARNAEAVVKAEAAEAAKNAKEYFEELLTDKELEAFKSSPPLSPKEVKMHALHFELEGELPDLAAADAEAQPASKVNTVRKAEAATKVEARPARTVEAARKSKPETAVAAPALNTLNQPQVVVDAAEMTPKPLVGSGTPTVLTPTVLTPKPETAVAAQALNALNQPQVVVDATEMTPEPLVGSGTPIVLTPTVLTPKPETAVAAQALNTLNRSQDDETRLAAEEELAESIQLQEEAQYLKTILVAEAARLRAEEDFRLESLGLLDSSSDSEGLVDAAETTPEPLAGSGRAKPKTAVAAPNTLSGGQTMRWHNVQTAFQHAAILQSTFHGLVMNQSQDDETRLAAEEELAESIQLQEEAQYLKTILVAEAARLRAEEDFRLESLGLLDSSSDSEGLVDAAETTPEPLAGSGRAKPKTAVAAPALNTLNQPQVVVGAAEQVPVSPASQRKQSQRERHTGRGKSLGEILHKAPVTRTKSHVNPTTASRVKHRRSSACETSHVHQKAATYRQSTAMKRPTSATKETRSSAAKRLSAPTQSSAAKRSANAAGKSPSSNIAGKRSSNAAAQQRLTSGFSQPGMLLLPHESATNTCAEQAGAIGGQSSNANDMTTTDTVEKTAVVTQAKEESEQIAAAQALLICAGLPGVDAADISSNLAI